MTLLRCLYSLTIFLSAFLLLVVEPMAAKQLLPTLGGSSAVWTTCLVFFSVALLLGYLYAHWISSLFDPKRQAVIHILILTMALLTLGIRIQPGPAAVSYHPALTVFRVLATVIAADRLVCRQLRREIALPAFCSFEFCLPARSCQLPAAHRAPLDHEATDGLVEWGVPDLCRVLRSHRMAGPPAFGDC
jgi:hypothetical protein